jgi:pyruvate formate lyase activating enzyme
VKLCGQKIGVDDILAEIATDEMFCKRGGGVTFSGGEAMLQASSLTELLRCCKERGFHTALDTAGNVPETSFSDEIIKYTDIFLFDIKAMSPGLHKYCTGSDNQSILRNIRFLSRRGASIWIRIPFIFGLTCSDEEIAAMSGFIRNLQGVKRIELLAYHAYGESKYTALGKDCSDIPSGNPPAEDVIRAVIDRFIQNSIHIECPTLNNRG